MLYILLYLLITALCYFVCKVGFKMEWTFLNLVLAGRPKLKILFFFIAPILLLLFAGKRAQMLFLPPPPTDLGTPPDEGDFIPPVD